MRKYGRAVRGLVGTGLVLGVGSSVVERTGSNASGLSTMSSFMPTVGTTMGAGMALNSLSMLSKKRRRK